MTVDIRSKFLKNRKILITGNPLNCKNLAHGFKKIYPDATFIHNSNGWDLNDFSIDNVNKIRNYFKLFNTFINASYIGPFVQSKLLEIYHSSQKYADVFNIGSTHEYDELGTQEYKNSKLDLRNKSLQLNTYRFRTHHIILGGIHDPTQENTGNFLVIDNICQIIPWILDQKYNIPLICIDHIKKPW